MANNLTKDIDEEITNLIKALEDNKNKDTINKIKMKLQKRKQLIRDNK
jgi:hypothetical protein